ncbi:MAG: radical SAM protein [Candidatus Omnitrophica bacterium]|nr:radical SAM protein [Candidatus Omnitrophota bacterium]
MSYLKEFETNLAYHFSEVLESPIAKPYWVYISLSHKCTYDCQMCGVVKILKGYELPTDVVKGALDEIAQWNWDCVIMFTGGEAFLRKDIFDLIGHSVKKGLTTEVVSNGSLIDERLSQRITVSGLNNIAISLDGAKESTHDSIRKKGSFKKAIRAIENLVSTKRKTGHGPQISVWTTIMKENVRELFDIIGVAKGMGVECLVYHPVIVAQDDMQNTSPDAPFWIRGDDLKILKAEIDKIVNYQRKHGLVSFLHNPYMWVRHFECGVGRKDWKCNPFVFINIGPDGEMRSCGSAFGNIKNESLGECLRSEDANEARRLMKACQKPCLQTCWAHPESDSLADITKNFLAKARKDKKDNKKNAFKKAYDLLSDYQEALKKHD